MPRTTVNRLDHCHFLGAARGLAEQRFWERVMGATIEEVGISEDFGATAHSGVTCIFCGLPTRLHATAPTPFETHLSHPASHVSIVRCEICGKEATYLSREVAEFGDVFRARRTPWAEKEYECVK